MTTPHDRAGKWSSLEKVGHHFRRLFYYAMCVFVALSIISILTVPLDEPRPLWLTLPGAIVNFTLLFVAFCNIKHHAFFCSACLVDVGQREEVARHRRSLALYHRVHDELEEHPLLLLSGVVLLTIPPAILAPEWFARPYFLLVLLSGAVYGRASLIHHRLRHHCPWCHDGASFADESSPTASTNA